MLFTAFKMVTLNFAEDLPATATCIHKHLEQRF
jgi:hypothetical protein